MELLTSSLTPDSRSVVCCWVSGVRRRRRGGTRRRLYFFLFFFFLLSSPSSFFSVEPSTSAATMTTTSSTPGGLLPRTSTGTRSVDSAAAAAEAVHSVVEATARKARSDSSARSGPVAAGHRSSRGGRRVRRPARRAARLRVVGADDPGRKRPSNDITTLEPWHEASVALSAEQSATALRGKYLPATLSASIGWDVHPTNGRTTS